MFVHEFLHNSAKKYPEKTALVCGDQKIRYHELDEMAARCASALVAQGIKKGGRLVIVNPNSVETIAALFGILKAGGVFLVVHHSIKEKKLSYILKDCDARAVVLFRNQIPGFTTVLETCDSLRCMIVCGDEAEAPPAGRIPSSRDTPTLPPALSVSASSCAARP